MTWVHESPCAEHRRTDRVGLLLFWLLATAANLHKPYTVDDTAHLVIARWIMVHPLHPMSGLLNWSGTLEPIFRTNQPHLYFYLLAAWASLFGFGEPAMHVLQSGATALCLVYVYRLARQVVPRHALWVTALIILGPAFVVEQNLMVDVPLLATWTAFFFYLVAGIGVRNQTARFLKVALACSLAMLIKYSSLVLLPVFLLALVLERRRAQWWTFLLPLTTLAGWCWFNLIDYGSIHILARPVHHASGDAHPAYEMTAQWLLTLGGLTPLGLAGLAMVRPKLIRPSAVLMTFCACFAILVLCVERPLFSPHVINLVLNLLFALGGAFAFSSALASAAGLFRRKALHHAWPASDPEDFARMYLLLWLVLTTLFYIAVAPFIASRHLLLILPPLTLLLAHRWQQNLSPAVRSFSVALTVMVSCGLCVSDWRFASFYKQEAQQLPAELNGQTLWTNAHWGWQWYAEQAGIQEYDVGSSHPSPGSLMLVPREIAGTDVQQLLPLSRVRTDTDSRARVSLFCIGRTGDFYMTLRYRGPWTLDPVCDANVDIYRVNSRTSSR